MLTKYSTVAGILLATVLALTGCSSAIPNSAEPTAEQTAPPAPLPSKTQSAKSTVEGEWCPTPESADDRCVTVALPTVTWDDGVSDTLAGAPPQAPTAVTSYSFVDAPFGDFYPAGTSLELPDYYSGKDLLDHDRIWNSQTSVLLVRKDAPSVLPTSAEAAPVDGFPAGLAGD